MGLIAGDLAARSARAEIRNPILALPAARAIADQVDGQVLELLARLLLELGDDCADRARKAWRTHKAPMACYWKLCSVYARHIARALRSFARTRASGIRGLEQQCNAFLPPSLPPSR